jgi:hypothetical protein
LPQGPSSKAVRAISPASAIDGPVNLFESGGNRLAVFPGHEIEAMAQQLKNAGLDHHLRKDGGNCVGKPFEAVDDGDQDVLDTTVFQLVYDAQPEFGTLILLEPEAEDLLGAVGAYAERDTALLRTGPSSGS